MNSSNLKKILQACKPDPVSAVWRTVIIYLSSTLLLGSICLPSIIERAVLRRWFMWHFSMQGLPAEGVTIISRELLPHVFTFSPCEVVIFCGTVCCPGFHPGTRLFTGALLCAVRTFLVISRWSDNPACSKYFKETNTKIRTDQSILIIYRTSSYSKIRAEINTEKIFR